MAGKRVLIRLLVSISCGIAVQNTAFSQEYRGSAGQQMACTPDVWRLCSSQVPDVDRIVACLRRNTPQLSRGCRAVFEESYNAPRRGDDQGYSEYEQRPYNRNYEPRPYHYEPRPYRQYGPRPYDEED